MTLIDISFLFKFGNFGGQSTQFSNIWHKIFLLMADPKLVKFQLTLLMHYIYNSLRDGFVQLMLVAN